MAIFYLDTSAIVKRYRQEQGSEVIAQLLENPPSEDRFYTSFLSVLEFTSAILRLARGGQFREELAGEILANFRIDVRDIFMVWPLDNDLVNEAVSVVFENSLRSGDAIHLATAISLHNSARGPQVVMVSADIELLDGAEASALAILDVREADAIQTLEKIRSDGQ